MTADDLYRLVRDLPSGLDPARRARPGAAAVPFILLWLVALRALGRLPRLAPRRAAESRKPDI